ncbi:hypothetical protein ACFP65_08305 [Marinilactibacillus sp. GCM10026970]|uniref:hypothetical protein n=1 Tax=Marinilactibacillus sp. GCM10026970 TaxID=3252642 RepID=UPI00360DD9AE
MKGAYSWVEQKLRDYAQLEKFIKERKLVLQYPPNVDYNPDKVQTSGYQGDPVADVVEKWMSDKELIDMKREYDTIKKYLSELDELPRRILKLRYMSRQKYTWKEIIKEIPYTREHCISIRKKCLDELGNRLSWEK